jgi:hypothetical protein
MGKTISHCQGKGSLSHNNRDFIPKNVDKNRVSQNLTLKKESIKSAYKNCFGEAVKEYNAKQTRKDRQIDDYYKSLFGQNYSKTVVEGKNQQKSFYEDLVQVGTMEDTGCGTPDAEIAIQALKEYAEGFEKRNPNFYVFNSVIHVDEATPHLHLDYIPLAHNNRGLSVQNGLGKALDEMGFGRNKDSINQWRIREREVLEEICLSYGLKIDKSERLSFAKQLTVDQYKEFKDLEKQRIQEQELLNELKGECRKYEELKLETVDKTFLGKPKETVSLKYEDFQTLKHLAAQTQNLEEREQKLEARAEELEEKEKSLNYKTIALKGIERDISEKQNRITEIVENFENKVIEKAKELNSDLFDFLKECNLLQKWRESKQKKELEKELYKAKEKMQRSLSDPYYLSIDEQINVASRIDRLQEQLKAFNGELEQNKDVIILDDDLEL